MESIILIWKFSNEYAFEIRMKDIVLGVALYVFM